MTRDGMAMGIYTVATGSRSAVMRYAVLNNY